MSLLCRSVSAFNALTWLCSSISRTSDTFCSRRSSFSSSLPAIHWQYSMIHVEEKFSQLLHAQYLGIYLITNWRYQLTVITKWHSHRCKLRHKSGGANAEHEPIMGVWGQSLQRGPEAEPLVRRSGGKSESIQSFRSANAAQICQFLLPCKVLLVHIMISTMCIWTVYILTVLP